MENFFMAACHEEIFYQLLVTIQSTVPSATKLLLLCQEPSHGALGSEGSEIAC
jgi:hypothetical protein